MALAVLDQMISKANDKLDQNNKDKVTKLEAHANLKWIESLLGIGLHNPYMYFQIGVSEIEKNEITQLIEQRNTAKKEKDFTKADAIRSILEEKHIQLMDTVNGTQWEKVN